MPRLVAGSIGSVVTALTVTPLEVVKVRQQMSAHPAPPPVASCSSLPKNVAPCPKGCGTFVLNNGIMDCVLPRSAVKFFDPKGQYRDVAKNTTTMRKQPWHVWNAETNLSARGSEWNLCRTGTDPSHECTEYRLVLYVV